MKSQIDTSTDSPDFPPLEFDEQEMLDSGKPHKDDKILAIRRSIERRREEKHLQQLIGDYNEYDEDYDGGDERDEYDG